MQNIVKATLVLENCEYVVLDASSIANIWLQNIHYDVRRIDSNCISKSMMCDQMYIELSPQANDKYISFGHTSDQNVFERLTTYNDIAAIELEYDDGTKEYCIVPWCSWCDEDNTYQSSFIEPDGRLCVLISESTTIKEFLDTNRW